MDDAELKVGDGIQYVWAFPPEYDEGTVIAINGDGSFDAYFEPEVTMIGRAYDNGIKAGMRLGNGVHKS